MPKIEGTPIMIRCAFEKWVQNCGLFELVHDGSKGLGDKRRYFFTKVYVLKVNGKLTEMGFKFVYDYRAGGWANVIVDDIPLKVMDRAKAPTDVTAEMVDDIVMERAEQRNGVK